MKSKKSLKLNVILNMMLTLSGIIFPLITFPYVTRVLQPEGTGRIAFANSVVNYFSMLAAMGIPTYGIRTCAKVRDDKTALSRTVHEIMTVNLIMTVLSYIFLFIAVAMIEKLRDMSYIIAVFSLNFIFALIGVEWLYKALECYSYITARSLIMKALAVILMFVFVRTKEDYIAYAAILVLANTGYGILNFINLRKYVSFRGFGKCNYIRHIKPIIIFFAMSVATTVYTNLDTTMLGFMRGNAEVGIYDVAVKIKVILVSIVTSLGTVLLPRASYYIENKLNSDFFRVSGKALEFVLALAIPCTIAFSIAANQCIVFISGNTYAAATIPMRIIMPTLIFIGLTNIIGLQMLVPLGREKAVLCSEVVGAAIDFILNMLLISKFGAAGAAFGTLAAEAGVLIIQLFAGRKELLIIKKDIQPIKIIAAALIAAIVMSAFIRYDWPNLFLELVIIMSVYFIVYAICIIIMREPVCMELLSFIRNKVIER